MSDLKRIFPRCRMAYTHRYGERPYKKYVGTVQETPSSLTERDYWMIQLDEPMPVDYGSGLHWTDARTAHEDDLEHIF